ncbi:hypothetical protein QT970_03495 [Microcoleus sp. herbarium8]|uniref:hypothetical protein n=1 Tax=Microcoleus sp. herbarium8 TaxID=3055436 RepID=UPI002FD41A9D
MPPELAREFAKEDQLMAAQWLEKFGGGPQQQNQQDRNATDERTDEANAKMFEWADEEAEKVVKSESPSQRLEPKFEESASNAEWMIERPQPKPQDYRERSLEAQQEDPQQSL